jgi:hypothetical protein
MRAFVFALATAIVFTTVTSKAGYSQTRDNRPTLQILVDFDEDGEARRCGITTAGLRGEVSRVLRNNGIVAASESTRPHIYVVVTVLLASPGLCVVSRRVSIEEFTANNKIGSFSRRGGSLASHELCQSGGIQTWDVRNQRLPSIEELINSCLGQLEY